MSSATQFLKIKSSDVRNALTIASGCLSRGISASIAGGSFWAGVRQGLITSGLNHVAHSIQNAFEQGHYKPPASAAEMEKNGYKIEGKTWEKKSGRWTMSTKKEIFQWDSKKGEVEVYNKGQKKHLGGFDPKNRNRRISKPLKQRIPNGGWKVNTSKMLHKSKLLDNVIKTGSKIGPKVLRKANIFLNLFDYFALPLYYQTRGIDDYSMPRIEG